MDILGHSQISLTLNTYSHVMPSVQREAIDRMDAVLRRCRSVSADNGEMASEAIRLVR